MLICNVAVYNLIWEDHDQQYHLSLAEGRLRRLKCVKHHSDDDDDAIQKAMDLAYESQSSVMVRDSQLQLWQRRLVSSWGHRHWRCEEWFESCQSYSDRTMFQPMMLLCKQMYGAYVSSPKFQLVSNLMKGTPRSWSLSSSPTRFCSTICQRCIASWFRCRLH